MVTLSHKRKVKSLEHEVVKSLEIRREQLVRIEALSAMLPYHLRSLPELEDDAVSLIREMEALGGITLVEWRDRTSVGLRNGEWLKDFEKRAAFLIYSQEDHKLWEHDFERYRKKLMREIV